MMLLKTPLLGRYQKKNRNFCIFKLYNQLMIHFFRKIRHQLLSTKSIKKYILYALGEIILVMFGILLALQFNNWNQENENTKKEEIYLINVVEDIEYQKGALKEQIIDYEYSISVANKLLKDYNRLKSFTKIDSLNNKLNVLTFAHSFPNTNNTYQELVSSGQQSLIQEKELSLELIDFYLFCEDNFIEVKNNNDNLYYKEVYPVLNRLSQNNIFLEDDDEEIVNNKTVNQYLITELDKPKNILALLNAIKTQRIIQTIHLEIAKETLEGGKELTTEIDKYLGLTFEDVNHYD